MNDALYFTLLVVTVVMFPSIVLLSGYFLTALVRAIYETVTK